MSEKTWEIRGDKIVSVTYFGNDGFGSDETEVEVCTIQDKDYARLIVACVNACAGIPSEKLDGLATMARLGIELTDAINDPDGRFNQLERQRDELLAALKRMVGCYGGSRRFPETLKAAKQAIERAKTHA